MGPLGTNFSEILIKIHIFSSKKMHLNMLSGKWWPLCLGLNSLMSPFTNRDELRLGHGQVIMSTDKCEMLLLTCMH